MPATTTRPVTARQQSFIASLAAERTLDSLCEVAAAQAAAGTLSSRDASTLIERLLAMPSTARPALAPRANRAAAEDIARPSQSNRAGRMLAAGGIEATVTIPSGEHVTIRINTRRPSGRGWANCAPTDEGARTNVSVLGNKVGWVNVSAEGQWTATLTTRRVEVKDAIRVLFGYCAGHTDEKGQMGAYRVQEASRCGRCMRPLTDPVSIDRGIGPECLGRTTGSRHVAPIATPDVDGQHSAVSLTAIAAALEMNGPRTGREQILESAYADGQRDLEAYADAEFARREREQENAAYRAEMEEERALGIGVPALRETPADPSIIRARDLIAEALDAHCSDVDRDFAMRTFDNLVAR